MKRLNCRFALILALALGFSAVAYADTVPDGAVRFNLFTAEANPIDVPVPKGSVLVITEIIVYYPGCDFFDGPDQKTRVLTATQGATAHVSFQSGLEFYTQLRSGPVCRNVTLSGYWLNPS